MVNMASLIKRPIELPNRSGCDKTKELGATSASATEPENRVLSLLSGGESEMG